MLLRRVARPLLATIFIAGGIDTLMNPQPRVRSAKPLVDKGKELLALDRDIDPSTVVRADAAVTVGAGVMLALGRAPRIAAAILAAGLIPSTVAAHPFWSVGGDQRQAEQEQFLKNAGLLGGLLLAAADTRGKPSLAWRAKHSAKRAKSRVTER